MAAQEKRRQRLRKYLVTGLLIWVPLTITVLVIRLLVDFVDGILLLLPSTVRPEAFLGFRIPGLGALVVVVVLLLTGMLFANLVGQRLVHVWEGLLARIPFVGSVYRGTKQVAETVLSQDSRSFRQVVMLPWGHPQTRVLGFVTGAAPGEVQERLGEDQVMVFVPTTPNPTSGFLFVVPRRDTVPLQMTVEEAFGFIVSLGVAAPAWPRGAQPAALAGGPPPAAGAR